MKTTSHFSATVVANEWLILANALDDLRQRDTGEPELVEAVRKVLGDPTIATITPAVAKRLDFAANLEQEVLTTDFSDKSWSEVVWAIAQRHAAAKARELPGNRGPWVRHYTRGPEGLPWCAGFVCTVLRQAAKAARRELAIKSTLSCDNLLSQAKKLNALVEHGKPAPGIFLVMRTAYDAVHTGFAWPHSSAAFDTVEGNTAENGSREGTSVLVRRRAYSTAVKMIDLDRILAT